MIAAFSTKTFNVSSKSIYTFDDFNMNSGIQTERQEVEGRKPKTHVKGLELDTMQFRIILKASLGHDVDKEHESWKAIQDAAKPHLFILGSKPKGKNKWLLKNVGLSGEVIDDKGRIIEAKLTLQFEEYESSGSSKSISQSSKAAGVSKSSSASPADFLTGDKSTKRNNVAMQRAVAKGLDVG